jgi:hypothetical protein
VRRDKIYWQAAKLQPKSENRQQQSSYEKIARKMPKWAF